MATKKVTTAPAKASAKKPSAAATAVIEIPDVKGVATKDISTVVVTATAMSTGLVERIEAMPCITKDEYLAVDAVLGTIRENQKKVDILFNDEEKGLIRPIRLGLDRLYALQRALKAPFDAAETAAKSKMGVYILEEKRIKDEAEREERARLKKQQDELNAQMEAKAKELGVPTPVITAVFLPTSAQAPVKGQFSRSSVVEKVRLTSMDQLEEAIECGLADPECVVRVLNSTYIDAWFKSDPEAVKNCPGLEVYDAARIAGKG